MKWLGWFFALFFLAWAILIFGIAGGWSHGFYPRECCSGTDCAPLASERVQVTPTGYVVDGQHHVAHATAKVSPDEHYHGCFPKPLAGKLGCFWAPRPAT